MKTMLVVTSDEGLHGRIARGLAGDGEITRLAPGDTLPHLADGGASFVIVDVRGRDRATVLEKLASYRRDAGPHARCIAIARVADALHINVVTTRGHEVLAAIFLECEYIEHVIRAYVNDSSRSAAAATAVEVVLRFLPRPTHEIISAVFGSAFRVSLVKQFAAHEHADRTSIGKSLREHADWTPKGVMNVAKASHAAMLLCQTDLTPLAVAKAVGFGKSESLGDLLERMFEMSAIQIQERDPNLSASGWLERELARFLRRRAEAGTG